jgi:hypothetical protein
VYFAQRSVKTQISLLCMITLTLSGWLLLLPSVVDIVLFRLEAQISTQNLDL